MRFITVSIIAALSLLVVACGDSPQAVAPDGGSSSQDSGLYTVWDRSNGGEPRIFGSELGGTPAPVSGPPAGQFWPAVSQRWAAWMDQSGGDADIVVLERGSGKTRVVVSDPGSQWYPALAGDWLVWVDLAADEPQIRAVDLAGGEPWAIGPAMFPISHPRPSLSGHWVTWLETRINYTTIVWAYDLEAQRLVRIARGRCGTPSVGDTTLAYRDAKGIHCIDLQSGEELRLIPLRPGEKPPGPPLVSGGSVLWTAAAADDQGYDLWVCDLATGDKRRLTTLADIDPSVGTVADGDWLVYVGVPEDDGAQPITAVALTNGELFPVASQSGLLTGVAVTAD